MPDSPQRKNDGADTRAVTRRCLLSWGMCALSACRGGARGELSTLRVFAASSLTEVFQDLSQTFESTQGGVRVECTFAGTQALRTQIEQGASADVFAAADEAHMQALVAEKLVSTPIVFAKNELVIIVPMDNPAGITSLVDLPRASKLVLGAPNVPVGNYTRQLLKRATSDFGNSFEQDVLTRVVSEETNVRLVRAKVELGEVDAAIVYRTDALASTKVKPIDIPANLNQPAQYYVSAIVGSPRAALASAWLALLQSPEGKATLRARGFRIEPN